MAAGVSCSLEEEEGGKQPNHKDFHPSMYAIDQGKTPTMKTPSDPPEYRKTPQWFTKAPAPNPRPSKIAYKSPF